MYNTNDNPLSYCCPSRGYFVYFHLRLLPRNPKEPPPSRTLDRERVVLGISRACSSCDRADSSKIRGCHAIYVTGQGRVIEHASNNDLSSYS